MADKIFKRKCSYCNKKIKSLSESQCIYNFRLHEEACRKKLKEEVNSKIKKVRKEKNPKNFPTSYSK